MRTSLVVAACLAFLVGCGGGNMTAGTGGSGVGTGTGGNGGGSTNACGVAEAEPNDTRDKATPYTVGAAIVGCVATVDDVDMYQFTSPATDPAGGYFTISFDDVGAGGYVDATVYAVSDNTEIFNEYSADDGGPLHMYFAAAPGQQYRMAVAVFSGFRAAFKYTMTATYTKIADTFEPNDTRAAAKPITLGVPVTGYLVSGYRSSTLSSDESFDYYKVTLPAGATTVKLTDPPTNILGELTLLDSDGAEIANEYSNTKGANVTIAGKVVTSGEHVVKVSIFSAAPESLGIGIVLPDHFTHTYTLTVQQP
jgi:hypothetical protein